MTFSTIESTLASIFFVKSDLSFSISRDFQVFLDFLSNQNCHFQFHKFFKIFCLACIFTPDSDDLFEILLKNHIFMLTSRKYFKFCCFEGFTGMNIISKFSKDFPLIGMIKEPDNFHLSCRR